ncbi:hypothetical protein P3T39_006205 [Kitasatospora sp. GP82]|nr:hypothetical protein [Kitasatospora sp. GP82]
MFSRLVLVLLAVAVVVLPALWFGRFDPARTSGTADAAPAAAVPTAAPAVETASTGWATAPGVLPQTESKRAGAFGRLLVGEVRILLQGVSRWWWLVAAALTAVGFALPMDTVTGILLPGVWLWPVLIWSRLGSQQVENGLEMLLGAYPTARRRLLAEAALCTPGASPRTRTSPAAAGSTPSSTFTRVDLPTPLGPSTAVNSPAPTARSTPDHRVRPPTRTAAARSDSTGGTSGPVRVTAAPALLAPGFMPAFVRTFSVG